MAGSGTSGDGEHSLPPEAGPGALGRHLNAVDGKVAVITGCAGGLGKQHALRFADEGARLGICDIFEEKLVETNRCCEEKDAEVVAMRCDVLDWRLMPGNVAYQLVLFDLHRTRSANRGGS